MTDENEEMKAFFKSATDDLFPKMRDSALSVAIFNSRPDAKLCMEIGAAILFDKPLIIVVPNEQTLVPATLERLATKILYGKITMKTLKDTITTVLGTGGHT